MSIRKKIERQAIVEYLISRPDLLYTYERDAQKNLTWNWKRAAMWCAAFMAIGILCGMADLVSKGTFNWSIVITVALVSIMFTSFGYAMVTSERARSDEIIEEARGRLQ